MEEKEKYLPVKTEIAYVINEEKAFKYKIITGIIQILVILIILAFAVLNIMSYYDPNYKKIYDIYVPIFTGLAPFTVAVLIFNIVYSDKMFS